MEGVAEWALRYLPAALGSYLGARECSCRCSCGTELGPAISALIDRCSPSPPCASRLFDLAIGTALGFLLAGLLAARFFLKHDGVDATAFGAALERRPGVRLLQRGPGQRALA